MPEKAAIPCSRIVRNRPLPEGNERVAYLCMLEYLERSGVEWSDPEGGQREIADAIDRLSSGQVDESGFVAWVRERCGQ